MDKYPMALRLLAAATTLAGQALLLVASDLRAQQAAHPGQGTGNASDEMLPVRKGAHWLYRGTVSWLPAGKNAEVQVKQLTWETTVVDAVAIGKYTVALILGHPSDLAFSEGGPAKGSYILVVANNREIYFDRCEPAVSLEQLKLSDFRLAQLTAKRNLIFKLPLREGETFGAAPDRGERDDTFYEWSVESVGPAKQQIAGFPSDKERMAYTLIYRTMPDHQISTYVPGIGLTAYIYSHHGTPSEVDMKLVKVDLPRSK